MEAIVMRNPYSDEELVACYHRHHSQVKAASELGVSRETVARAVRRTGIVLDGRKYNTTNRPDNNRMKITDDQLRAEAPVLSCREIAKKYGMSDEQVYRRAKKLNVEICTKWTGGHYRTRISRYGGAEYDESVTLKACVERYGGICQICGRPVDGTALVNGHITRLYPTIDHITPISQGGTHTWDNVQLAHMCCNSGKGAI